MHYRKTAAHHDQILLRKGNVASGFSAISVQYWMAILNKEKGYVTNLSSESESANKRCYL